LKCFLFFWLGGGHLKLMANDGALRGRVCCVCLKTALTTTLYHARWPMHFRAD